MDFMENNQEMMGFPALKKEKVVKLYMMYPCTSRKERNRLCVS